MTAGNAYLHPKWSKMLDNNCAEKAIWLGLGRKMSGFGLDVHDNNIN